MLPFSDSSFSPTSTPSATFHHLLSAGAFQPLRSLPLKIDGRSSFASAAPITRTDESTRSSATQNHFIESPKVYSPSTLLFAYPAYTAATFPAVGSPAWMYTRYLKVIG